MRSSAGKSGFRLMIRSLQYYSHNSTRFGRRLNAFRFLLEHAKQFSGTNRSAVLKVLKQASEMADTMKPGNEQTDAQLKVALLYCLEKNERCFAIMESLLPKLNELVDAAVKLDGYETGYIRDGEWNMSANGNVGQLLTTLSQNAGHFAWCDFDRAVSMAAQFDRSEIRLMAQVKLAQAILAGPPKLERAIHTMAEHCDRERIRILFTTALVACLICGPGLIVSKVEAALGPGQYRNAVASGRTDLAWYPESGRLTRRYRVTVLTRSNSDPISAQQTKDKWYRVYTGEGYVIEINASSLRFQPDHVLRVQFRTILSNPETLGGTSGEKYKTRLEAIEFKLDERRYRISDTTLLDSGGKELQWYTTDQMREWRVLKPGGVTEDRPGNRASGRARRPSRSPRGVRARSAAVSP